MLYRKVWESISRTKAAYKATYALINPHGVIQVKSRSPILEIELYVKVFLAFLAAFSKNLLLQENVKSSMKTETLHTIFGYWKSHWF